MLMLMFPNIKYSPEKNRIHEGERDVWDVKYIIDYNGGRKSEREGGEGNSVCFLFFLGIEPQGYLD